MGGMATYRRVEDACFDTVPMTLEHSEHIVFACEVKRTCHVLFVASLCVVYSLYVFHVDK